MRSIDCTNVKFGRLLALAEAEPIFRPDRNTRIRRYHCICDCGAEIVARVADLRSGNTVSCGCFKIETTKATNTTHGQSITVARGKASPEYRTWRAMLDRCFNPKHVSYPLYGAKGIKVCDEWRDSFEKFRADMGDKPSVNHSIDRIDNRKGYELSNCRWATPKQQFANSDVSPEFLAHIRR